MYELYVVAIRHETQFHAVGLLGHRKIRAAGQRAHFALAQLAERKFAARKLLLREPPEKIRLVFGFIARTQEFPAAGRFIPAYARVMAGGEPLCADLPRHAQERLELHEIGRASCRERV